MHCGGKIDEGDGLGVNKFLLSGFKGVLVVLMSDFVALILVSDMDCQIKCLFAMRIQIFFQYESLIFALQLILMSNSWYDV